MSIGISVKVKGNILTESFLVQKIGEMGFGDLQIERTVNGICINLRRELGTIIYFFNASDFSNGIWESTILCK
ncbi:MAG: hypothetical protein K2K56_09820, partial [Lachnospiraceae bacterium]|nr:hypothetical protein [Lachnospiraceae bacterium]